jgi:hypothetical protein
MSEPFPPELLAAVRSMADVVYSGESLDSACTAVCDSAVELVDGCDHASIMLRRTGRNQSIAWSDGIAKGIDQLENDLQQGPCIDVLDDSEPDQHLCTDLTTGSPWPDLAEQILTTTDVRGMAGFRLRQDGQKVGALNIFSDTPGALTQKSLDQAILLAGFASVAMAALARGEEAVTLRRGLDSNREIGKAIGLMMAMHDISDEAAFAMLAKVSQEMNIKLVEVAARVIAHHRGER